MIHPSAYVHPEATVHETACIGPWCIVDAGTELGAGVVLECRVRVTGKTRVGANTVVYDGAVLGAPPQDLKYAGEETELIIGENGTIREYCTLNRGTGAGGKTVIGKSVLLMAYTHIGHDSSVGDGAVLANGVQLGGHVQIGRFATIGGTTAVHQFSRVGDYAFVGGTLKIDRDVPPVSKAFGDPLKWAGLNAYAFQKHTEDFPPERVRSLELAYRELYRSGKPVNEVIEKLKNSSEELFQKFFTGWDRLLIRP